MAGKPGMTQTGPQTAACFLLVWTAPFKGPALFSNLMGQEECSRRNRAGRLTVVLWPWLAPNLP